MASAPALPIPIHVRLPDCPVAIAWDPAGESVVALGAEGRLWWVEAASGKILREADAHVGGGFQAAWQPGGGLLATSGQDGRILLWSGAPGVAPMEVKAPAAWVEHLRWSPDGRWLAAAAGREVLLIEPVSGKSRVLPSSKSTVGAVAWHPAGRQFATAAYGGVTLFDPESGQPVSVLEWKSSLISLAWSPDARWIVAGTQDLAVQVWELPFRPGSELAMSGYPGKVRELAWHQGGRILATAGAEAILVWNCGGRGPAGTEPRILQAHTGRILRLAFQHRGHTLASVGQDGLVFLWNAGRSTEPLRRAAMDQPVSLAEWSPDDSRLALGRRDGTIAFAAGMAV